MNKSINQSISFFLSLKRGVWSALEFTLDAVVPIHASGSPRLAGPEMTLVNAARYSCLIQRAQSFARRTAVLCTDMTASQFNKTIFAPAIQNFILHHCRGYFDERVLPPENTERGRRLHGDLEVYLYPFTTEDVGLIRAIWRLIDAKPLSTQKQFVHLFKHQLSKLCVGPHISVMKMLFRFVFFYTLEFQQTVWWEGHARVFDPDQNFSLLNYFLLYICAYLLRFFYNVEEKNEWKLSDKRTNWLCAIFIYEISYLFNYATTC